MDPLIDRREYAGLANCRYLNQASLGLIPRVSLEASVRFLTDIAQHGNLRLSDQVAGCRTEPSQADNAGSIRFACSSAKRRASAYGHVDSQTEKGHPGPGCPFIRAVLADA
jgi:hypothetical protein